MMKISSKISTLFMFFILSLPVFSQANRNGIDQREIEKEKRETYLQSLRHTDITETQIVQVQKIFEQIREAISTRDISTLTNHLRAQTYLNLPNGISGYYSANQAYFVLEDFLKKYRVVSFEFDEINSGTLNPYATGVYNYEINGRRNSVHLYIQLRESSKKWTITQITTN